MGLHSRAIILQYVLEIKLGVAMGPVVEGRDKAAPFIGRSRARFRVPPWVSRTQLLVTTSVGTRGGPVSCLQLSEGGFQVVCPLGL